LVAARTGAIAPRTHHDAICGGRLILAAAPYTHASLVFRVEEDLIALVLHMLREVLCHGLLVCGALVRGPLVSSPV